jgi:hypothetical protein
MHNIIHVNLLWWFCLFLFSLFFLMLAIIHKEFIYHNITYSGKVNYSDRITLKIYACKYMYIFIVLCGSFFCIFLQQ